METIVKERPILFSGSMVRALLAGTKTQTRRAVKPQPIERIYERYGDFLDAGAIVPLEGGGAIHHLGKKVYCPYGKPGDRLWVRETFYAWGYWAKRFSEEKQRDEKYFDDLTIQCDEKHLFEYPAEFGKLQKGKMGWYKRPSIFMPRVDSRLLLEIVSVRCERVQDISEADAVAEGVEKHPIEGWEPDYDAGCYKNYLWSEKAADKQAKAKTSAEESYESLWASINGPESWAANPWVWVVEFKVISPAPTKERSQSHAL